MGGKPDKVRAKIIRNIERIRGAAAPAQPVDAAARPSNLQRRPTDWAGRMTVRNYAKPPGWTPGKDTSKPRVGSYCGAWLRKQGRGCRQQPERPSGRCRLHGSKSTGPRTPEGKARVSAAVKSAWREWRRQVGLNPDWRYGSTWLSRRKRETAADHIARHGPWKPDEVRP
jgi:hypothetical protein